MPFLLCIISTWSFRIVENGQVRFRRFHIIEDVYWSRSNTTLQDWICVELASLENARGSKTFAANMHFFDLHESIHGMEIRKATETEPAVLIDTKVKFEVKDFLPQMVSKTFRIIDDC